MADTNPMGLIKALSARVEEIQQSLANLVVVAGDTCSLAKESSDKTSLEQQTCDDLVQAGTTICNNIEDTVTKLALLVGGRVIVKEEGKKIQCERSWGRAGKVLCLDNVQETTARKLLDIIGGNGMGIPCAWFRLQSLMKK